MEPAYIGLLGVFVGALLTLTKDWLFEWRKQLKNAEFLSIHIVCMLDSYVSECVAVVHDDGLNLGRDSAGYMSPQVALPKFEPQSVDVEWKSLPASLMYKILSFPNEAKESNAKIDAVYDFVATPPDYDEFFEERQSQYSILGLKAAELALELRKLGKIPENVSLDWNPTAIFLEYMASYENRKAQKEEAHRRVWAEMPREATGDEEASTT